MKLLLPKAACIPILQRVAWSILR